MTLKEVREKVNNGSFYGDCVKLTVIKRDDNIVVREHIDTPRNSNLRLDMLNSHVRRTLKVETTPNLFKGRKGIYTSYWAEAIIEEKNE